VNTKQTRTKCILESGPKEPSEPKCEHTLKEIDNETMQPAC